MRPKTVLRNTELHLCSYLSENLLKNNSLNRILGYCKSSFLFSLIILSGFSAKSQSLGCDGFAYLLTASGSGTPASPYIPSLIQLNLSTGANTVVNTSGLTSGNPNAMGYNSIDGNLWGFVSGSTIFEFTGSLSLLTYNKFPITSLPAALYNNGDISADGILYLYALGGAAIQKVDINVHHSTYLKYAGSIPVTPMSIKDFSFNPIDGNLYAVTSGTGPHQLFKIDTATGTETNKGTVAGLTTGNESYGSSYFDQSGNYYIQANGSGIIYEIDSVATNSPAAFALTTVPSSDQSDGARCNQRPVLLPVKLTSFTASQNGPATTLDWQTSQEINFKEYEVQYATDTTSFTNIGIVDASGNINGSDYSFQNTQPVGTGFYRLKIIDEDGSFVYSNVLSVYNGTSVTGHISAYPNPATTEVFVRDLTEKSVVHVIDMLGRVLTTALSTSSTMPIDVSNYPTGMYIIQVVQDDEVVSNLKIEKQ
ncbi:MAG TPA: T9SS type A sorting domain-containing protein [Ferruginibacter sp.]|jgi:hypothetical protein|nr:T9SS type A sorting domain-containing protein [Ferruginibacter sp.]